MRTYDEVDSQIPFNLNIKYYSSTIRLSKYNALYLNINALKNKFEDLCDLIDKLGNIHIIALTEIRIIQEENKYFNIPNYIAYFSNRTDGDGGVALYIHNSLTSCLMESVRESCADVILHRR